MIFSSCKDVLTELLDILIKGSREQQKKLSNSEPINNTEIDTMNNKENEFIENVNEVNL